MDEDVLMGPLRAVEDLALEKGWYVRPEGADGGAGHGERVELPGERWEAKRAGVKMVTKTEVRAARLRKVSATECPSSQQTEWEGAVSGSVSWQCGADGGGKGRKVGAVGCSLQGRYQWRRLKDARLCRETVPRWDSSHEHKNVPRGFPELIRSDTTVPFNAWIGRQSGVMLEALTWILDYRLGRQINILASARATI